METEGSRGSASPSVGLSGAAKRHRGHVSSRGASDSPRHSTASGAAAPVEDELPLPRALGLPPGSSNAAAAAAAGGGSSGAAAAAAAAAAGDPSARAVLHDYCRKVLKLAAFRLVAVR